MKRNFIWRITRLTAICFFLFAFYRSNAQYYILGRVLDDDEVPYSFSKASLKGKDYNTEQQCNEYGVFRFENLAEGKYELVLVTPYGIRRRKVDLRGSIDITLHVARNIQMDEISVVANKAGAREPVTHTDFSGTEIKREDFAKDLPYLLERAPSVVSTSDAGAGIGYTAMRIRGTDPTRINVTLNGIPVNDAESQAVFWVDLPDVASSSTSIQVQRGLGWSQPGTGDFGGAVNINTLGFHADPYLGLKLGAGSYASSRATLYGGTGLLNGRFTVDARGSYLKSDGYIDRSASELYALYGSVGYHHDQSNLRLIVLDGDEVTEQAWNGVPEQYVNDKTLRTFNTAGTEKPGEPYDKENDDYHQTNVQLHFDQAITPFARLTTAAHYTHGKGFFEQYKAQQDLSDYGIADFTEPTDLIRRLWLDNNFYGMTYTLHIGKPERRYFLLGGAWNTYVGDHYGTVEWVDNPAVNTDALPEYYSDDAMKKDWNFFVRSNMKLTSHLDLTLDLQGRWIKYRYAGPDSTGAYFDQTVRHRFFNPKLGLHYQLSPASSLYLLTGLNHKEPNRDDYVSSTPQSRPKEERLWDTELSYRLRQKTWQLDLTGYFMQYKDQLVPTGRLNDVGAYTRVNVEDSHRLGAEIALAFQPTTKLDISFNATLSDNKIKSFEEYIDNWQTGVQEVTPHENTNLAFSPNVLSSGTAAYTFLSAAKLKASVELTGRYVGKQFVDNTSRDASAMDAYFAADAGLDFTFYLKPLKSINLGFRAYNLFNEAYSSNGWIYRFRSPDYNPLPDDPYSGVENGNLYHQKGYFPQALRHFMIQLMADF